MKNKMVLSCLKLKQNIFSPLNKVCSHSEQKRFECFRRLEKMHSEKIIKQKRNLFRQRIEAATRGVL